MSSPAVYNITTGGSTYRITSPSPLTDDELTSYASALGPSGQAPASRVLQTSATPPVPQTMSPAGFDIGQGTAAFDQPGPLGAGIWHAGGYVGPSSGTIEGALPDDDAETDPDLIRAQLGRAALRDPRLAPSVPQFVGGEPTTVQEARQQLATSAGMMGQLLPGAAAGITDRLGQFNGERPGWWLNDPSNADALASQQRTLGILQYLIPGAGQAGAAQLGAMAIGDPVGTAQGLYGTAKQIGSGLVSQDTPLTERVADALAAAGLVYGGATLLHRGAGMLDIAADNAMISKLVSEGVERPIAEEAVRRAATLGDLVADNPGKLSPEATALGRSPMRLARMLADGMVQQQSGEPSAIPDLPPSGPDPTLEDRFGGIEHNGAPQSTEPPADPTASSSPGFPRRFSAETTLNLAEPPKIGSDSQGGLQFNQESSGPEPTYTPDQWEEIQSRLNEKTLPREIFENAGAQTGHAPEEIQAAIAYHAGTNGPITPEVIGQLTTTFLSSATPDDVENAAKQLGVTPAEMQATIAHHIQQGGQDESTRQQAVNSSSAQFGQDANAGTNGSSDSASTTSALAQPTNDETASNTQAGQTAPGHLVSFEHHESKTYDEWQKIADDLWDQIDQENPGAISDSDYRTWPANVVGHGPNERWVSNKPGHLLHDAYAQAMNARDNVERAAKSASLGALKLSPATLAGPVSEAGVREAAKQAYELIHSPMRFIGGDGSPVTSKEVWHAILSELISSGIHRDRTIDSRQFDTHESLYHSADRGKELFGQAISLMKDMGIVYDPHADRALSQSTTEQPSATNAPQNAIPRKSDQNTRVEDVPTAGQQRVTLGSADTEKSKSAGITHREILIDGKALGEIQYKVSGNDLQIHWLGHSDEGPNLTNFLGAHVIKDLLRQMKAEHPEIETVSGARMGGSRYSRRKDVQVPTDRLVDGAASNAGTNAGKAAADYLVSSEGFPFYEKRMDPRNIGVYPGLQYKRQGITDQGNAVTDSLKHTDRYDQATAGPLTVWQTNDGKSYVMNGHHRRELAIRTGEQSLPVRTFKESDGVDFNTARALGALQNLRDGKGTAIDAATVLRDLGAPPAKLRQFGIDTRSGIARDAIALLNLSPRSLQMVENAEVPEQVAAAIAEAGLPEEREQAAMRTASRSGIETRSQGQILASQARNAPMVSKGGESGNLFGDFDDELALGEQAKIADAVLRRLTQNQRAYQAFQRLQAVGSTSIDTGAQTAAAQIQELARQVISTDPETVRSLEDHAKNYAKNPTTAKLNQAVDAVVATAQVAAERRLAELQSSVGQLGQSSADGPRRTTTANGQQRNDVLTPPQSQLLQEPESDLELQPQHVPKVRSKTIAPNQGAMDLSADSGEQGGLQFSKVHGGGSGGPRKSKPQRAAAASAAGAVSQLLSQKPITGPEAAKLALRKRGADLARRQYTAAMQLEEAAKVFAQRSNADNLDFIHRMETGQPQLTHEDQLLAIRMRTLMDQRRDEIIALGTGKLENWIENYFPHIWKDPNKASAVFSSIFGKRPVEGSKSFLKKRSIPTIQEGMAAPNNLEPISYNPVDLTLAKLHEMDKYLTWQKVVLDLKERGLLKFVSVFTSPAQLNATGLAKIDDNSFTVFGPHRVEVSEAYDKYIVEQLGTLAQMLGVNTQRVMNIRGKKVLGSFDPQSKNVMTKFGSPEEVLTHELGHAIDDQFGLGNWLQLHGGQTYEDETSALAKYRIGTPGPHGAQVHAGVSAKHMAYILTPDERIANLIHAVVHAPELAKTVAPESVKLLHQFAVTNKAVKFVLHIKPGLEHEVRTDFVKVPGLQTMGHYAAEKSIAKILNNALQPGLKDNRDPRIRIPMRGYMAINNLMNRTNLGISAFHAITSTLNASISDVALGLRQLSRVGGNGSYWRRATSGVGMIARGAVPGASMVADLLLGSKIRGAYVGLGNDRAMYEAVEGVIAGGGRFGLDPFYKTGAWGKLTLSLAATYGALKRKDGNVAAVEGAKSIACVLPAIFDLASKPIMEQMVPKLKIAAFARMLESDMEQSDAVVGSDEWAALAARAWQSVDNRYGQLVYDNLFVHNMIKDLGMASVRSLGWNLGTFAEIGGGAADAGADPFTGRLKEEGISHRTAYTLAMPIVVGMIGGIMHYLMTGKRPNRLRDYFFPRTGRKLADGSDERIAIPAYIKDLYAYKNNPAAAALHKLAPLPEMITQMLNNKGYYGQEIRHENDPVVQQAKQVAEFMAKSFTPFTVSSEQQFIDQTGKPNVAAALGFTPAAPFLSRSPAELKAQEFMAEHAEAGPKTADQVTHLQDVQKVLALYQNGDKDGAQKMLDTLPLTEKQYQAIEDRLDDIDQHAYPVLRDIPQLTPEQALRVYDLGSKWEKSQLAPVVADRLEKDVESGRIGAWTPAQLKSVYKMRPELLAQASPIYR